MGAKDLCPHEMTVRVLDAPTNEARGYAFVLDRCLGVTLPFLPERCNRSNVCNWLSIFLERHPMPGSAPPPGQRRVHPQLTDALVTRDES